MSLLVFFSYESAGKSVGDVRLDVVITASQRVTSDSFPSIIHLSFTEIAARDGWILHHFINSYISA